MHDQMRDSLPFVGVATDASRTRVRLQRTSLASLVAMAYRVRVADVSGPSWISAERFNIDATLPRDVSSKFASEMMQSLLEDRFALKVHREKKQQNVYGLIVGKEGPKLRPFTLNPEPAPEFASLQPGQAMPAGWSPPKIASLPRDADGKPAPWFHLKGATMEALARSLSRLVGERVVDMTNLEGTYEVELVGFAPSLDQQDGTGPSIFDAVKDLGLRLERRKAELDVVVVDSAARKPTEN